MTLVGSIGVGQTASVWLAAPIVAWGAGQVLAGVFSMDPMRGYPPGTPPADPEEYSTAHQLHDWASIGVFVSVPIAALVGAITFDSPSWTAFSVLTAIASALLLALFGALWEHDHRLAGLAQRMMIIVAWTWLGSMFLHLAHQASGV